MKIISGFLFGLVIISLVTTGLVVYINDVIEEKPELILNTSFNETFNKIKEVGNLTNELGEDVRESTMGEEDTWLSMSKSLLGGLKMIISSMDIWTGMVMDLSAYTGLPSWAINGIIILTSLSLLAAFFYVVFRVRQ